MMLDFSYIFIQAFIKLFVVQIILFFFIMHCLNGQKLLHIFKNIPTKLLYDSITIDPL